MNINFLNKAVEELGSLQKIMDDLFLFQVSDGLGVVICAADGQPFPFEMHIEDERIDKLSKFVNIIHNFVFNNDDSVPADLRKKIMVTINGIEGRLIENDVEMRRADDEASKLNYFLMNGMRLTADMKDVDWSKNIENLPMLSGYVINAKILIKCLLTGEPVIVPGENGEQESVDAIEMAGREYDEFCTKNDVHNIDYTMFEGLSPRDLAIIKMLDIIEVYRQIILQSAVIKVQGDISSQYENLIKNILEGQKDVVRKYIRATMSNDFTELSDEDAEFINQVIDEYVSETEGNASDEETETEETETEQLAEEPEETSEEEEVE